MRKEFYTEENGQMYIWNDLVTKRKDEKATYLHNITSDDDSRFTFSLTTHSGVFGDIFVSMDDEIQDEGWSYFRPLRLRGLFGGGLNPFITEEFISIMDNIGQPKFKYKEKGRRKKDRINSNSAITVERSTDPKLNVKNIGDDDGEDVSMDIVVQKSGDVLFRLTGKQLVDRTINNVVGEMLFKTKENDGKNPIMAETLTRIAQRIAKANR